MRNKQLTKPPKEKRKLSPLMKGIRRDWQLILIALPAVVCLLIFAYGPMAGVLYAFQKVGLRKTIFENEWVGLKWFGDFFSSIFAGRVIKNTLILNFWTIFAGTIVEIFLAIVFNEVKDGKFKRLTQSCSYFPNFISVTVVVGIMVNMLNPASGVLSLFMQKYFGAEPLDLFIQPNLFRPLYVISGLWQGAGWGAIIYLGAINGIDQSLYEAAAVDGHTDGRYPPRSQFAGETVAHQTGEYGACGNDHRDNTCVRHRSAQLLIDRGPCGPQQGVRKSQADERKIDHGQKQLRHIDFLRMVCYDYISEYADLLEENHHISMIKPSTRRNGAWHLQFVTP